MPKANVYNMAGQQVGEVELSEGVFGVEPNEPAVHAVVVNHLANCRQGTQSALTRAEVSGGGKALETERYRPCPPGQHPCAPVDPRRYRLRPQAQRLQLPRQPQAEAAGSEVRPLRQGRQRRPAGGG